MANQFEEYEKARKLIFDDLYLCNVGSGLLFAFRFLSAPVLSRAFLSGNMEGRRKIADALQSVGENVE